MSSYDSNHQSDDSSSTSEINYKERYEASYRECRSLESRNFIMSCEIMSLCTDIDRLKVHLDKAQTELKLIGMANNNTVVECTASDAKEPVEERIIRPREFLEYRTGDSDLLTNLNTDLGIQLAKLDRGDMVDVGDVVNMISLPVSIIETAESTMDAANNAIVSLDNKRKAT